jgi:hypothetical protein
MTNTTQAERDAMTYSMYVDCGCSAAETARQMGISAGTVRARVRRQVNRDIGYTPTPGLSAETEAILARIETERAALAGE